MVKMHWQSVADFAIWVLFQACRVKSGPRHLT